jgi:hypothetical protein
MLANQVHKFTRFDNDWRSNVKPRLACFGYVRLATFRANGKEATVNRALDGSMYPG